MAKILFRLSGVMAVVLFAACEEHRSAPSFIEVQQERTVLVGGLQSYQTISEVRSSLGPLAEKWEVLEDSGKGAKSSRPPFEVFTAVVRGYMHEGFKGELRLTFFNNRLMSTWFYPEDPASYRRVLSAAFPNLKERESTNVAPFTLISIATDHRGKRYFAWGDSRLQKEMEIWIRRYS
jgi:hypothetical protein